MVALRAAFFRQSRKTSRGAKMGWAPIRARVNNTEIAYFVADILYYDLKHT